MPFADSHNVTVSFPPSFLATMSHHHDEDDDDGAPRNLMEDMLLRMVMAQSMNNMTYVLMVNY